MKTMESLKVFLLERGMADSRGQEMDTMAANCEHISLWDETWTQKCNASHSSCSPGMNGMVDSQE